METYIPQSSIRTVQRNLINTVRQNKQQLNFTDNRPVATSQRKTLQNMGQQKTVQMKKTASKMIARDLKSPLRDRYFNSTTIDAYMATNVPDNTFVVTHRQNIVFASLGGQAINNIINLNNWLTTEGEKIYLWQGGQLIGGNNLGGPNKICHPNLIGGDPDVDYAGTFEQSSLGWKVTNDSGHFQFPANYSMQAKIAKYANKMTGQDLFDVQ